MNDKLSVVIVNKDNNDVFNRLIQNYEAEFSSLTEKMPAPDGLFPLDTLLDENHIGYLAYLGDIPVGFNVIASKKNGTAFEVCEFYIIPVCRMRKLGYELANAIFDQHRGNWEVKQIAGADNAKAFWRKTIKQYTQGSYSDEDYNDTYWGPVTRQQFRNSL